MKEANIIKNGNPLFLSLTRLYLTDKTIKPKKLARVLRIDRFESKQILKNLKDEGFLILTHRGFVPTEAFIKLLLEKFTVTDLVFKLGVNIDDKNLRKAICEKADRDSQLFYDALKEGNKNE